MYDCLLFERLLTDSFKKHSIVIAFQSLMVDNLNFLKMILNIVNVSFFFYSGGANSSRTIFRQF